MCEDLRKQIDVRIVTHQPEAQRCIAKPNFAGFKIINEDATMVKMNKTSILWRKPTYVGFTILELSKLHMYKFHYEQMVPFYTKEDRRCKLLFTDTDSLCYELHTKDVYADMLERPDLFDTSDYPPDHKNFSTANAKVLGKMKDECAGVLPSSLSDCAPRCIVSYSLTVKKNPLPRASPSPTPKNIFYMPIIETAS